MTNIDLEVYEELDLLSSGRQPRRLKMNHKPKKTKWEVAAALYERDATGRDEKSFNPSVNATSEEMVWIIKNLAPFYHGHLIGDVTRRVKAGKEANVYMCRAHPESGRDLLAAKLYRPRKFRSLKNTTQYDRGRTLLNGDGSPVDPHDWRLQKAIAGKSRRGLEVIQTSWITYEFTLLQTLHWAQADVPEPIKHNGHALLMEYIGDESMPAPALIDVALEHAEAKLLFERVVWNIETMLRGGCVHGDLSAYNVLYWEGNISIIDFPQVVDPQENPNARFMFRRDVDRVCQYFARYGVQADARRLANGLWAKYVSRREAVS